ncbi:uncharacterized protein LOC127106675 isoform X2 [Lathyrus oleraceus]|uniref:uncharacterized protein LOC127106675 isoform X2 n=1 Tax=Pisum sativum TaxID=3888 RepID=UPI0021CF176B|nr:uncharacterized protein LOC127106675 isoform X2 [Pisum sativum]
MWDSGKRIDKSNNSLTALTLLILTDSKLTLNKNNFNRIYITVIIFVWIKEEKGRCLPIGATLAVLPYVVVEHEGSETSVSSGSEWRMKHRGKMYFQSKTLESYDSILLYQMVLIKGPSKTKDVWNHRSMFDSSS